MTDKIIIADAGPLIAFGKISQISLLVKTLGEIIVPDAVLKECLVNPAHPGAKEIKKDSVPSYLRMKSIKLGKVVERQFYINQLKQQFADTWTDGLRKEFIAQIKHSEDGDLFTIANNFLKMKLNPQEKIEIVIAR